MTKLAQEMTESQKKDFIKKERETLQGIINDYQQQIFHVSDDIVPSDLKKKMVTAHKNTLIRKINAEIAKRKHNDWSLPSMREQAIKVTDNKFIDENLEDPQLNSMISHLLGAQMIKSFKSKKITGFKWSV